MIRGMFIKLDSTELAFSIGWILSLNCLYISGRRDFALTVYLTVIYLGSRPGQLFSAQMITRYCSGLGLFDLL